MLSSNNKVVIDTNVFVGSLNRGLYGLNRYIIELCLRDELQPLMSDELYFEYEDLIARDYLYQNSKLNRQERNRFFDAFCNICQVVDIYYRWRPNLKDEGDNHIIELAISGGASHVITWNARDFQKADLVIPDIKIMRPDEFVKIYLKDKGD
jgi:putative PIN family toxin of toxin-antitoxin system